MAKKEIKRVDAALMRAVIERNKHFSVAVVFQLAWNLGLAASEMADLKWDAFSFEEGVLRMPDREIPIDEETALFLQTRKQRTEKYSPYVLVADRTRTHTSIQVVSAAARKALDEGGLQGVTLLGLRRDFIIRQLEQHDWHYAAYVTGTAVTTLYQQYAAYFVGASKPQKEETVSAWPEVDEERLGRLIEELGDGLEALVLLMCWKLQLGINEFVLLTWEQVDLEEGSITLLEGESKLDAELLTRLRAWKARREAQDPPQILLTPRTRRPYDSGALSRLMTQQLIRAGMSNITIRDISRWEKRKNAREQVLQLLKKQGKFTQKELRERFDITVGQAYALTKRMEEEGSIVCVGASYFPAGTVAPPEKHYELIRAFLEEAGTAYREDLRSLLGIAPKQCTWILRKFVNEGKLVRRGQKYTLPEADPAENS